MRLLFWAELKTRECDLCWQKATDTRLEMTLVKRVNL